MGIVLTVVLLVAVMGIVFAIKIPFMAFLGEVLGEAWRNLLKPRK
jgi:hypothetical protein